MISPVPLEARPYQGRRAGVVTRLLAGAIDMLVVVIFLGAAYVAWTVVVFLVSPWNFDAPNPRLFLGLVAGYIALLFYLTLTWATTGRSYGKHVMGLRVVDHRGDRLRLVAAAVRAVCCVGFPFGLLWVAVSRENCSLQDSLLRTSVIHDWTTRRRDRLWS